MEMDIDTVSNLVTTLINFGIEYGFQILGALVVLVIGLRVAKSVGALVTRLCESKGLDVTLSKFLGSLVKIVLVVMVVIITLGQFGITIAPIVALAGAAVFGSTMALQGPLSNYGAGLSIILTRPFVVGNVIAVRGVTGVVDEVTLAATFLKAEDGERITIPNKEIVGEVLVNSRETRIVEMQMWLASDEDAVAAIAAIGAVLSEEQQDHAPKALCGVEEFSPGGVVIGIRYFVPALDYFAERYRINARILAALRQAGVELHLPAGAASALSMT